MLITVTGLPGTGKTTVVKLLAENLQYPWYSMGDLRGEMAMKHNMTIDAWNTYGETHPETDAEIDEKLRELGSTKTDAVIDGRLAWHFIPNAFHILLTSNDDTAVKRIMKSKQEGVRSDEPGYTSEKEAREIIHARTASDVRRYQKYYQLDFLDPTHYHLIFDTSDKTAEQSVAEILKKIPHS